jgi:hypothetical protein
MSLLQQAKNQGSLAAPRNTYTMLAAICCWRNIIIIITYQLAFRDYCCALLLLLLDEIELQVERKNLTEKNMYPAKH